MRIALCVALTLAVGCSKDKDKPKGESGGGGHTKAETSKLAGSCDTRTKDQMCSEFGGGAEYKKNVESDCTTGYGGTFIDGPCPTDGIVGRCVNEDGFGVSMIYYAPKTADEAKAMCGTMLKFEAR